MSGAVQHQPATTLPWRTKDAVGTVADKHVIGIRGGWLATAYGSDADYIAHAANAYPKLVAALDLAYRTLNDKAAREEIGALLNDLGEAR